MNVPRQQREKIGPALGAQQRKGREAEGALPARRGDQRVVGAAAGLALAATALGRRLIAKILGVHHNLCVCV